MFQYKVVLSVLSIFLLNVLVDSIHDPIIYGIERYPYVAFISVAENKTHKFQCNGLLIADRWVLTAAHCVADIRYEKLTAVAGVGMLSEMYVLYATLKKTQCRKVVQVAVHPCYDREKFTDDIALVQTDYKFIETRYVKIKGPSFIPEFKCEFYDLIDRSRSMTCTVAGHGKHCGLKIVKHQQVFDEMPYTMRFHATDVLIYDCEGHTNLAWRDHRFHVCSIADTKTSGCFYHMRPQNFDSVFSRGWTFTAVGFCGCFIGSGRWT